MPPGYDFATFETTSATLAAESVDDYAPPRGRAVIEKLLAALQLIPPASASGITEHDAYGWAFDVHYQGARIWCMLQRSDAWLLITEMRPSLLDRLRGH